MKRKNKQKSKFTTLLRITKMPIMITSITNNGGLYMFHYNPTHNQLQSEKYWKKHIDNILAVRIIQSDAPPLQVRAPS